MKRLRGGGIAILSRTVITLVVTSGLAAAALPLLAQSGTAPVARYDMRAGTVSGMDAMGGGRAAMSMLLGGGLGGLLGGALGGGSGC